MSALAHALDYAEHGLPVLPIKPGTKRPPMGGWQNHATTNKPTIENWFTGLYSDHGVGIATGGTIFALDIDVSDGKKGDETLADLELQYGPLPYTATVLTGSGGQHRYFLMPAGVSIRNNASTALGPGLDIRGEGGQCVAPPTIHPNGRPYEWDGGEIGIIAPAPKWLISLLTARAEPTPAPASTSSGESDSVAARYNDQTTWSQLLSSDGWTLAQTMPDGEQRWVRPGKDAREGISATVGHGGGGQLTVFSSSIAWLPEGSYSRFGYYACRHHQGDRSAAASRLYELDMAPVNALLDSISVTEITHGVMADVPYDENDDHGWNVTDLSVVLSEDYEPIKPTKLARLDGPCLFYAERINALYGESGSGKSWVAMALCADEINAGNHVVYFDLEDHAGSMAHRMMSLGVSAEDLIERFFYVSPTGPWGTHAADYWVSQVSERQISVCVVDSTG
ncbi:MAG: bifunctional DNA primase/polymerase, partial [Actinomycetes bacterium]